MIVLGKSATNLSDAKSNIVTRDVSCEDRASLLPRYKTDHLTSFFPWHLRYSTTDTLPYRGLPHLNVESIILNCFIINS
jgi:hypothetical protein